nr:RNA-directed DNA polymerase, eukaryota [Tanacetum cinerariifolium]
MAIHGSDGKVEASTKAVGNGENIMFWEIPGTKESSLIDSFRRSPRGGAEQQQYNDLEDMVTATILAPTSDRLVWSLESSGEFTLASVRKLIDDKRGIIIDLLSCVLCDNGVETSNHLFFPCCFVRQVFRLIMRWWDVPEAEFESYAGWLDFRQDVSRRSNRKIENLRRKNKGGGRYIPPHSRNHDNIRQHGKEEIFSQDSNEAMKKPRDFNNIKCYNCNEYGHYASRCHKRNQRQQRREASYLVEEDLEPILLMASTSFNKTLRKSSKDTPTNKSIWFAEDYDHEDSKFGEIILEEDKEGHDQDCDKLSMEDQQAKGNNERKPRVKTHFWSTIISKVVQGIKRK